MTRARSQTCLAESIARAFVEGDALALQALVVDDVVDHSAAPGQPSGWAGLRERAMTLCAAMPEGDLRIEVLSTDGDTVLARIQVTAPRTGTSPAGSTSPELTMVLVLRFADGRLSELWTSPDQSFAAFAQAGPGDWMPESPYRMRASA